MATGGEKFSYSIGSDDFHEIVCDPCQEDGELHKAVGMCIDCKDHICQKCYDAHKIARPFRKHELLDKEALLQSPVSITKDKCTEKCAVHEEEVIKYYCVNHSHIGCSVCITLDHRTCGSVRYIPHVAKYLASNEEYRQVESHLISAMERSRRVTEGNKQNTESLNKDCSEAVKMVRKFRKDINEVLDKAEADLLQRCKTMKSAETAKLAQIINTFKTTETELHALMNMKEVYQNNNQNCNLYTLMMKTNDKVKLAEERIKEAEKEHSHINTQIKFVANKETLDTLNLPETLGKLLRLETSSSIRQEQTNTTEREKKQKFSVKKSETTKRIVKAEYVQDINIQYKSDNNIRYIYGLVMLPDNRLVTADYMNSNVKLVDIKHSQIITCLTLSSDPFDVAMVTNSQVAITMPDDTKVAIVNVTANAMTVERTLDVDGACYGVDYRNGKLVLSYCGPDKVQVITLQGIVLHSITTDQQGHNLFNAPHYVVFGQYNTYLYVSNYWSDNVVKVKFDGTVVGTYTDSELCGPRGLLTDSSGHVYVCGWGSLNIHQITPDCRKVQVLLTDADGLRFPQSISYSETDGRLYVGINGNNVVKVYRVIFGSK